jgi:hypothetical protein
MPKLTETFAGKISPSTQGTAKYWDSEIKGLVLFVGNAPRPGTSRRTLVAEPSAS